MIIIIIIVNFSAFLFIFYLFFLFFIILVSQNLLSFLKIIWRYQEVPSLNNFRFFCVFWISGNTVLLQNCFVYTWGVLFTIEQIISCIYVYINILIKPMFSIFQPAIKFDCLFFAIF